jgi:hypothetical protein
VCWLAAASGSARVDAQAPPTVKAAAPPASVVPAAAVTMPASAPTGEPLRASVPAPAAATPPSSPPSPLNPAPDEFPRPAAVTSSAELDALMSRVSQLRSRIAALTSALFSSKLRIELRSAGDNVRLVSLGVSVDGGVVYTAPAQAFFERPETIYEHAVAPGAHVIAVEVERQDPRNPQFSTWQLSRFVVLVPEQKLLWTRVELEDESNMAEDFQEDSSGRYDLAIRLQAEVAE